MAKAKTSNKPKKSLKYIPKSKLHPDLIPYSPTEELLDENFIANAMFECLKNNDSAGVMEVIETYLDTVKKVHKPKKKTVRTKPIAYRHQSQSNY